MSGHCFSSGEYNVWAGMSYLGRLVSCWRQRGLSQRRDGGLCLFVLVLFLAGLCGASMVAQADVLHTFVGNPSDGATPLARMARDAAGSLYGTTSVGGASNKGVVFKLRVNNNGTSYTYTILHSFTGTGSDGATPVASLFRDNAGNLYGTTESGGTSSQGVVFSLSPLPNGTYTYATLYSFSGADGAIPQAGPIRTSDGTLYGTTSAGGTSGNGVVFSLSPPFTTATSSVYTILHSFTGSDGAAPLAGVIRASDGSLYGTTSAGGANGVGVVFSLSPNGDGTYSYATLHSFTGTGSDGATPVAGVIRDENGFFYGTTSAGGANGVGVVFQTATSGAYTTLYSFTGGANGATPEAGVFRDIAGNLYGTTSGGGIDCGGSGCGVVFKLSLNGNGTYTYAILYNFSGAEGANPLAELVRDLYFNFFGTTSAGGDLSKCSGNGCGVAFKIPFYASLHAFSGADGSYSFARLVRDSTGNLYGTTSAGGANGVGVVFKRSPPLGGVFTTAASGTFTPLYNFTGGTDGSYPVAGLTFDSAGNLYGTTSGGGANGVGVVFRLSPPFTTATSSTFTPLYSFTGGTDGAVPVADLVVDSAGNTLYGTTSEGGGGRGVVFKFQCTPGCATATTGVYAILHSFNGADGATPQAGLALDSAGTNLYGTTSAGGAFSAGVVFRTTTTGVHTVLHSFSGLDGATPQAGMALDGTGTNLYGTTSAGGAFNAGVVFRTTTTGAFTTLYSFTGGADGANPIAELVLNESTGKLYGTTSAGGDFLVGVVFQLTTTGTFTRLYSFTGVDGTVPAAGLVRDVAGSLYGTTLYGGPNGQGNVFLLRAN